VIWAFTFIMTSGLLGRFPKLRVGFIETGSEWVPYAINQVRRTYQPPTVLRDPATQGQRRRLRTGVNRDLYRDPAEWFRDGRAFVTCELDEDLPYLLEYVGEDGLMLSSDYPHGDPSADETYVEKLGMRADIPDRVKAKLLGDNASRFFRM
jgi:predicted TIM-barrel fold metal-dependent hydrolase